MDLETRIPLFASGYLWREGKSPLVFFQRAQGFLISSLPKLGMGVSNLFLALIDNTSSLGSVAGIGNFLCHLFNTNVYSCKNLLCRNPFVFRDLPINKTSQSIKAITKLSHCNTGSHMAPEQNCTQ